ncbi:MAG TPA: hypothetical protein VK127_01080, partial [Nitrososphaerales archaeon]|nr:hypothetical protein [Nitrososphaerales archaeon]
GRIEDVVQSLGKEFQIGTGRGFKSPPVHFGLGKSLVRIGDAEEREGGNARRTMKRSSSLIAESYGR